MVDSADNFNAAVRFRMFRLSLQDEAGGILSAGKFAEKLGISRQLVSEIEQGRCGISPKVAKKIFDVFGVDIRPKLEKSTEPQFELSMLQEELRDRDEKIRDLLSQKEQLSKSIIEAIQLEDLCIELISLLQSSQQQEKYARKLYSIRHSEDTEKLLKALTE